MTVSANPIARDYVQLALAMGQHIPGYVDAYYNPLYRSYIFTYRYGGEMLDALFATQGDRDPWFVRLLTEPVTPSQIRSWTEG